MKFNFDNAMGNILKGHSIKSSLLSGLASSGLSGIWRTLALGTLGTKSTADVYITDLTTGDSMQLSWVPEKISVKSAAHFQSYSVIEKGEVKIPKGESLSDISWSSTLPGEDRINYGFVKGSAWESPKAIITRWEKWKKNQCKLRVMITQTAVNMDVYLQDYHATYSGGSGDAEYQITFVAAKDMLVKTVKEVDAEKAAETASNAAAIPALNERASRQPLSGCTMPAGGNLWSVAQQMTGNGGNWGNILSLNSDKISDPENVAAGIKITLP